MTQQNLTKDGSLLEYLTIIKAHHINIWYDAICAVFFLSAFLIGPFVGIWYDKTKKFVPSLVECIVVIMCGTFIYCVPYSKSIMMNSLP